MTCRNLSFKICIDQSNNVKNLGHRNACVFFVTVVSFVKYTCGKTEQRVPLC